MFLSGLKRNTTLAAQRLLFGAVCPCCEPALVSQLHWLGAILAWGGQVCAPAQVCAEMSQGCRSGRCQSSNCLVPAKITPCSRGRVYFCSHIMQIPGRGARRFQVSGLRVDTNCWCRDQGSGFAKITGMLNVPHGES